jgi:ribonuclease BN (tRNA processing enzyme)
MFNLIALGLNGFIPTYNRHTMCFILIDESDEVFILDAGSGLSRLKEPKLKQLLSTKKRLNIVLSHYHLDHVIGLSYLPGVWEEKPIRLYAPNSPFVDTTAEEAINKLLNPPLFSLAFKDYPNPTEIIPICHNKIEIGNYNFDFLRLEHPGGSMGIKINNKIAYITDTFVNENYIDFIKNSDYLLHEVWMTRSEAVLSPNEALRHSVLEDVIDLVKRTNVSNLIPIHFNPNWSNEIINDHFGKFVADKHKLIKLNESTPYILD